jgi:hypothetical protein
VDVSFTTSLFQNNDYNVPGIVSPLACLLMFTLCLLCFSHPRLFVQNDALAYGVIVENYGNGEMSFSSTCWVDNRAHGNALVADFSEDLPSVYNDYGRDNEVFYLAALECEFVAHVDRNDQTFPNLACANFEADTCPFDIETS